jgi:hypothetical protein
MLVEAIYQLLKNDSGVKGVIGTRTDGTSGIFPGVAPEEIKPPFVEFQQIGAEPVTSFEGNNAFQKANFQFNCTAADFLTAHKLSAAVKNVFGGLFGTFGNGGSPVINTPIEGAWLTAERDLPAEEALHATLYQCQVDFEFHFVDLG